MTIDDFGFWIWKNMKPQELEDRLIDFAVAVIGVVETLPETKAGRYIAWPFRSKINNRESSIVNAFDVGG
jgi:hypothetical protein